jgi:excisionase family DNA binding protein
VVSPVVVEATLVSQTDHPTDTPAADLRASDGRARVSLSDPLLTADQAAAVLGAIPSKTVLQLAREGRLPSVRIGRHVRFVRAELEATLSRRRRV